MQPSPVTTLEQFRESVPCPAAWPDFADWLWNLGFTIDEAMEILNYEEIHGFHPIDRHVAEIERLVHDLFLTTREALAATQYLYPILHTAAAVQHRLNPEIIKNAIEDRQNDDF